MSQREVQQDVVNVDGGFATRECSAKQLEIIDIDLGPEQPNVKIAKFKTCIESLFKSLDDLVSQPLFESIAADIPAYSSWHRQHQEEGKECAYLEKSPHKTPKSTRQIPPFSLKGNLQTIMMKF